MCGVVVVVFYSFSLNSRRSDATPTMTNPYSNPRIQQKIYGLKSIWNGKTNGPKSDHKKLTTEKKRKQNRKKHIKAVEAKGKSLFRPLDVFSCHHRSFFCLSNVFFFHFFLSYFSSALEPFLLHVVLEYISLMFEIIIFSGFIINGTFCYSKKKEKNISGKVRRMEYIFCRFECDKICETNEFSHAKLLWKC